MEYLLNILEADYQTVDNGLIISHYKTTKQSQLKDMKSWRRQLFIYMMIL